MCTVGFSYDQISCSSSCFLLRWRWSVVDLCPPRSALEEPVIIKASSCSASLFEEFILRNGKMLSATKNIKHSQILNPRHATKTPASAVSVRSKASYFTSLLSFLKKCSLWPWQPKLLIKLNHKIAFTFYFLLFIF